MPKNNHSTKCRGKVTEHLPGKRVSAMQASTRLCISTPSISLGEHDYVHARDKFERYHIHNRCVKRRYCNRLYLCGDKTNCTKSCSGCDLCNELCSDFVEDICERLYESIFCCNGCMEEYDCTLPKRFRLPKSSRDAYLENIYGLNSDSYISAGRFPTSDVFVGEPMGKSANHTRSDADEYTVGVVLRRDE